jgi:predicted Zn-dependent protease
VSVRCSPSLCWLPAREIPPGKSRFYARKLKEKVARELQVLAASKPRDAALQTRLAEILLDLNRVDEASLVNQEQLRASSNYPGALVIKGRILLVRQQYAAAKDVLDRVVLASPQSAEAHYFLGVADVSLGLSGLARAAFTRA